MVECVRALPVQIKCRARNDVNAALDRHGTLTHQAAVIHDIVTIGETAAIGAALGVVEDPDRNLAVAKEVTQTRPRSLHRMLLDTTTQTPRTPLSKP